MVKPYLLLLLRQNNDNQMRSLVYFKVLVVVLCVLTAPVANAAPPLSEEAEISLLTCSSGPALYKTFGHNAFRVKDPILGLDRVYNYGTFDFDTENFYLKFVRGKLNYWLSTSNFDRFLYEYAYYKQSVFENEFNLTQAEKQRLFDFLENNALPENRFYLYDFFFDNCATRIRDAMYHTFGDDVLIADSSWYKEMTFREGVASYSTNQPWSRLGMDLGLGIPTDRKMDIQEIMFLPEYLMKGLESMVLKTETGEKPLLRQRVTLLEGTTFGSEAGELNYVFLLFVMIVFGVIYLTLREYSSGMMNRTLNKMVFLLPAIMAVVQLLLWFATDHKVSRINPDLLWTVPALVLLFSDVKKNLIRARMITIVFIISTGIYLFLFIYGFNQNLTILPLAILVATRVAHIFFHTNRKLKLNTTNEIR